MKGLVLTSKDWKCLTAGYAWAIILLLIIVPVILSVFRGSLDLTIASQITVYIFGFLSLCCIDFLFLTPLEYHLNYSEYSNDEQREAFPDAGSIMGRLHAIAIKWNLSHIYILCIPIITIILLGFVIEEGEGIFNQLRYGILPVIMVWLFLLETGIAAVSLPRTPKTLFSIILFWIIPVLLIVFWGGTKVTSHFIIEEFNKTHWNVPSVFIKPKYYIYSYVYSALLIIPTVLVYLRTVHFFKHKIKIKIIINPEAPTIPPEK
jgi:hypothetical protein